MNRFLITTILACFSFLANAQSIFKKEANWIDNKDGVNYEMNIYSKSGKDADAKTAKADFTIIGDLAMLEKVELKKEGKLKINLALKPETSELQLQPGLYTFKIYHKKLGIKDFDVELKNAQKNNIKLTIK
ncbi:hypothetical protein [Pedobacter agri]|uniref:hypothetical protein n=1 Tax=Pedobacter agri TaxID=454586 RepID=UPI00292D9507|nr:hypothetical protein [Pedobacter agri]